MRYRNASPGKKVFIILLQLVMLTYVLLIIYPLFNMVMSSFKSTRDIMLSPFSLPESFSFENYVTIWVDKGFGRYFLNSLLFTGGAMVFVVLFGSMAAYGIARYKFRGNTLLYMLFLSGILETDVDAVTDRAQQFGFERLQTRTRSGWAVVRFKKK